MYLSPVMTAFNKRNRLIYTCTGEAERKRWNSSYEKLPNVNYAFHHLLSYLFTSEKLYMLSELFIKSTAFLESTHPNALKNSCLFSLIIPLYFSSQTLLTLSKKHDHMDYRNHNYLKS